MNQHLKDIIKILAEITVEQYFKEEIAASEKVAQAVSPRSGKKTTNLSKPRNKEKSK